MEGYPNRDRQARDLPQSPFLRARDTRQVPVRVDPSRGYTEYLTHIDRDDGWQARAPMDTTRPSNSRAGKSWRMAVNS